MEREERMMSEEHNDDSSGGGTASCSGGNGGGSGDNQNSGGSANLLNDDNLISQDSCSEGSPNGLIKVRTFFVSSLTIRLCCEPRQSCFGWCA